MGFAFQIQVDGTLDGTTPLVWPDPLPAPVNGVFNIAAGDATVNVGRIDLDSIPDLDTVQGYWLRAYQVEVTAATLGLRSWVNLPYQSTQQIMRLHCDIGCANRPTALRYTHFAGACQTGLRTFSDSAFIPPGGAIRVLNDSASVAFAGARVAGPHFIYFEVDPIRTSAQFSRLQRMMRRAEQRWVTEGAVIHSTQATAASLTSSFGIPLNPLDRWGSQASFLPVTRQPRAFKVRDIYVSWDTATAAGESMVYTVFKRNATATTQLATFTVAQNTSLGSARVSAVGAIDESANVVDPRDEIRVVRAYVAGGGPTFTGNTVQVRLTPLFH